MIRSNVTRERHCVTSREIAEPNVRVAALIDGFMHVKHRRVALSLIVLATASCTTTVKLPDAKRSAPVDSIAAIHEREQMPFAHGAIVYVNAMNCEMTAEDARKLNEFAKSEGISIAVVFVGLAQSDSLVVRQATKDLGLVVPARALRDGELSQYKSIGIARMPMAVVIKGKQLATIVTGETMPKTVGLIQAAFSPTVGQGRGSIDEGIRDRSHVRQQ